ncbi:restriction endonuclease subunit S [Chromatium okenii]|uniref:restriction endonuclease subunit S n=1 Tax=Chromatium okenii TaxID=61644 RepID=UPI0026EC8AE6|nr:restriction endonuclease subunit S [Chromatium okenii]MBV5311103.1 restriction endonuclease subunit S [Chromatium okenii]
MKTDWQVKKLGAAFSTMTGGTPPKCNTTLYGDFLPFVKPPELLDSGVDTAEDSLSETGAKVARVLPTNSILVSCIGNLGKVGLNTVPVAFNQQINAILPDESKATPWFLFYQALSCRFKDQLEFQASGTTVRIVNKSKFNNIEIILPPLHEQHRIVAILDQAFAGIATAKANAEQNLKNARALFESHLQSVFTERGEGWVERSIGDVCMLKSGTSVSVSLEKASGDLPYVKVSDMTHAGNETDIVASSRYLDMTDIGKNAVFPTGTTIFPKRGGAILTNKKRLTTLPICADLNIMGVIPPSNMLPKLLYFYFLNVDMRQICSGSSIPQINNYDIAPLKISFPESQNKQGKFVWQLEGMAEETQHLESIYQRKLAALDDLKKSLLNQAFSGQL